jgi:hypothetical protein
MIAVRSAPAILSRLPGILLPEIVLTAARVESNRVISMNLAEWGEQLTESLADGPGAPALLTLAPCRDTAAGDGVMEMARRAVTAAGWPLYENTADQIGGTPLPPQETGFLILRDVVAPLPPELPTVVAAFQHLVRRGRPVGLLVVGSADGIDALRRHPAMGFLSRAECVVQGG